MQKGKGWCVSAAIVSGKSPEQLQRRKKRRSKESSKWLSIAVLIRQLLTPAMKKLYRLRRKG